MLNLGHTFGHAIERMEGYGGVAHGEGVALGMILACRASRVLGLVSQQEGIALEERLSALLKRLRLPTAPESYLERPDVMAEYMAQDKKVRGEEVTLILPIALGENKLHPVLVESLPELLGQLVCVREGG